VAAGRAAVYPNLWANDGLLMSETFASLATAATLLFTYRVLRRPSTFHAAGAGIACAIAALSRAELALLVPLLVLPAVLMARSIARDRRLRLAGVVVLASALALVPWVGYNLARFRKPVLISHSDGGVLLGANCDETYSGSLLGSWYGFCYPFSAPRHVEDLSVEATRQRDVALEYAGEHLGRLPVVVAARIGRTWGAYRPFQGHFTDGEFRPRGVRYAAWASYWALVALTVAGGVTLRRQRVPLLPLLAPAIIVTLTSAVFHGAVRFRAPAEVSLVVLAAIGLGHVARIGRARPARARATDTPA
jgi:4-amino-4-deoxy-L-arabinose transferase-like glycosyltransferase